VRQNGTTTLMIERTVELGYPRAEPIAAHLIFGLRTGTISFLDAAAAELFGVRESTVGGRLATGLIPELVDPTPRSFTAAVRTAVGVVALDLDVSRLSGDADEAILVAIRTERSLEGPVRAEPAREERLESLWSLVVRRGVAGSDQVRTILREALVGLGLEHAVVGRVDGADIVVAFASREEDVGGRVPLTRSPARAALDGAGTFAVLDARREPGFVAGAGVPRCSLTAAFRVGDERYAATVAARAPRNAPFGDADWRYVEDVAEALARAIERMASDARFERLAYSDSLTSLPNRFALMAKLDEALAESDRVGGRTAVFFLDVDGFKSFNDTVGHRGGDSVLAEIAARLRSTLRREEYVGRLGGDEFAVIVPQFADAAELAKIAQRIAEELTFPFAYDAYRFSLSASIGVAVYPDDARDRETLLAMADDAMYSAKAGGGSHVRFLGREDPLVALLPRDAPSARPAEQYALFYQPILDVSGDSVTAVEALVRQVDPVRGPLAPDCGWSIARDLAGQRDLDRFVLREAARQSRIWQRAGISLWIDVNLAAYDPAAIDELVADETLGDDVRRLRIEIAAARLGRPDELEAFVAHGAASGLAFCLDGFDGSLASLPALGALPIEAIKLDRELVESALANPAMLAVVQGTALVARSLGWRVVAKGVETHEQQRTLVGLGCDAIQGYVVAKPMTAADLGAWLADRHRIERQA